MNANPFVTAVMDALEPFVGRMAAETCIRATAISAGKTSDDLDGTDMQGIDANIRRLLAPIAPASTIDSIVEQIRGRAA